MAPFFWFILNQSIVFGLKMPRVIYLKLLLCVVLICSAVSASAQSRETINVWHSVGTLDEVLKSLALQFTEQNSAIQINLVSLPYEELKTSVVRTVTNNNAPDIAIFTSDNAAYADMMRLSRFPLNVLLPYWDKRTLNSLMYDGKLYGLPLQRSNRLLMFYNKSLVEQPALTWQQIIQASDGFKQRGILPVGILFREPYWFAHFATLFATQFIVEDRPALNSVEMAETLKLFSYLVNQGTIRDDCGYDCVSRDFYNGDVAYAINGTWAIHEAISALGEDFGIIQLPSFNNKPMKALSSTVMLTFPNNSWNGVNRNAVRAFSKYLRTKASQIQLAKATFMLPINLDWVNEMEYSAIHKTQVDLLYEAQFMPAKLSYVGIWNALRKGMLLHHSGQLNELDTSKYMQKAALDSQRRMMELDSLR